MPFFSCNSDTRWQCAASEQAGVEADTDGRPPAGDGKGRALDDMVVHNALEEQDSLVEGSLQRQEVVAQDVQPCLDEDSRRWRGE